MWVLLLCALAAAQVCDDECSKILGSVNEQRRLVGAQPVCIDNMLMRAAMVQAMYQSSINNMSHAGAGGTNVADRVTAQGYKWTEVSENVAMGQTTARQVMLGWMNSEGHRKNILNPISVEMGIAHVGEFWAQAFGTPRPGSGGCNVAVPGGSLGTLEPVVSDSGPVCDALCQSILQVVNQKRAEKGELALCINGKLQTAAANMAQTHNLDVEDVIDDTGFGTKGAGAAEHTIKLSRGLPTDQNILDMLKKSYRGSGNGQNFTRGGIASDARRELWVIIEAATYTPDVDRCASTGGSNNPFASSSTTSFTASTAASTAFSTNAFPSFATTNNTLAHANAFPSFAANNNTFSFATTVTAPSFASSNAHHSLPRSSALVPPPYTDCSKLTSPCQCTGTCGWASETSTCVNASVDAFTDCTECPSQARCQQPECSLYTSACQCAASGCGWSTSSQTCVVGGFTDCTECPTKAGCSSAGRRL